MYLLNIRRFFKTSSNLLKVSELKNKSKSSREWLIRNARDPYVKMAKYKNYRARSAFKLIEIDDRFQLLSPGITVVECGAAPGAWTQVVVERINSSKKDVLKPTGNVIALDLNYIESLEGAVTLSCMDMKKRETHEELLTLLKGEEVDLVLSDMCHAMSGVRQLDSELSLQLFMVAFHFSIRVLKNDGTFLAKILDEHSAKQMENTVLKYFRSRKLVKPQASRSESSEVYMLCRNFSKQ